MLDRFAVFETEQRGVRTQCIELSALRCAEPAGRRANEVVPIGDALTKSEKTSSVARRHTPWRGRDVVLTQS